jgi:flagellar hook-basal body complex protein FliE
MKITGPFAPTPPVVSQMRLAEVPQAGASVNSLGIMPGAAPGTSSTGGTFDDSLGSAVTRAVESLDRTQKGAEVEIARAVAGESPDLHQTVIALQTADLQFQLALQVRNKFVNAYEEIMRMQV